MGWITKRLGNGLWGTVDGDVPENPPQVSFSGTITSNPQLTQRFGRLLNRQLNDNEEIRMDKPSNYNNGFEYIGVAADGSSPSAPVWDCIRITWVNFRTEKAQFRSNIVWDDRTVGWN